jgi:hypothetical protein
MAGGLLLLALAMQGGSAPPTPDPRAAYRACGERAVQDQAIGETEAPAGEIAQAATARCEPLLDAAVADLPEADTPEKIELTKADYRQRSIITLTQTILAQRAQRK